LLHSKDEQIEIMEKSELKYSVLVEQFHQKLCLACRAHEHKLREMEAKMTGVSQESSRMKDELGVKKTSGC
jgi:hypothetical protein